jgi:hypothetical protein
MPNLTRVNLVARIGDLIGDPSNVQWTAAQKQAKIDEWQEQFVLDTRALKDVQTTPIVSGTYEYDLPSDVMDILRVSHNGLKLERVSAYDLDVLYDANWADDTGTPTKYFVDLDPDNKKIRVYPIPQSEDASYSLIIEYVKMPPALADDTSVPWNSHTLMTPYHMAIAYGVAADLLRPRLLADPNPQPIQATIREYEHQYDKLKGDCIETFKAMGESSPLSFAVGRYFKNL